MTHMNENEDLNEAKEITAVENMSIMEKMVKYWHLGPEVAYDNQQNNDEYWSKLSKIMFKTEDEVRRYSCASCKYGEIKPEYLKAMEHVPYNKFDKDGGIRVWCERFDFICHATRVCQEFKTVDSR